MKVRAVLRVLPMLLLFAWQPLPACAQELLPSLEVLLQEQSPQRQLDKDKLAPATGKQALPQPSNDAFDPFAQNGDSEQGESTAGFNPHMMGDFGTIYTRQTISVTGTQTITTTTTTTTVNYLSETPTTTTTVTKTTVPVSQTRAVLVPVAGMGAFNIAENESPRPTDRVFFFYNFFDDIRGADIGSNVPIVRSSTTVSTSGSIYTPTTTTVQTDTLIPGVRPRASLDREVFGFEKTFLDGQGSVEVRLPLLQLQGGDFYDYAVGDLTLVSKYAFILDRTTGDVLSGGLALTLPVGPAIPTTTAANINCTLIQPWAGYIWNFDQFYLQGIHSLVVPTNATVPTLMLNDVGLNYWLYRGSPNQFLSAVVPTFEAHMTTPLTNRGSDNEVYVPDVLILSTGAHFGLYRHSLLTLGVAAPVTGPTPFSVEAFVQFNWYF